MSSEPFQWVASVLHGWTGTWTQGYFHSGFITVAATNRRRSFPAPPDDVMLYSSQSGTIPVARLWEIKVLFPMIFVLKAQQSGTFLNVLGIMYILWDVPCPQLQFLATVFQQRTFLLFLQCCKFIKKQKGNFFLFKWPGLGERAWLLWCTSTRQCPWKIHFKNPEASCCQCMFSNHGANRKPGEKGLSLEMP